MASVGSTGLPNVKPNSGCSTYEVTQKAMDDASAALKKVDETVDKFIKTEEGIAKKESIKKKIGMGILAFAAIGTTAVALAKSGKVDKLIDAVKSLSRKTFADIEFSKGNATLKKSGKAFSGKIVDKLGNGDSVEMVYKNGVLQKSTRKGSKEFVKEFLYDDSSKIDGIITKNKQGMITKQSFFKDGKIRFACDEDNCREFNDNGLLKSKDDYLGLKYQEWYDNGTLKFEKDFPFEKCWFENGQIKGEQFGDGSVKTWFENGQLEAECLTDGSAKRWDKAGNLIEEAIPNGKQTLIKQYDASGKLINEETVDEVRRKWTLNDLI